jgi:hypothetical protein
MTSMVPSRRLGILRTVCDAGARVTSGQIDAWHDEWLDAVSPTPADQESLVLVNEHGQPFSPLVRAPRWLCHLLGLRHQAVHILRAANGFRLSLPWCLAHVKRRRRA